MFVTHSVTVEQIFCVTGHIARFMQPCILPPGH